MGAKCCFEIFKRVQTSVLLKFYGPVMCRNRPDVGNIIPITRLLPGCFTFCKTCHVIYLFWYFKNCQLWVLKYTTIHPFKWDQILSWIYEVISYNISYFFLLACCTCYTQTDSLFKKKCSASQWKHDTIHIACQPFSCKIIWIHRLEYSITQLEPRKVVMEVIKTLLSD